MSEPITPRHNGPNPFPASMPPRLNSDLDISRYLAAFRDRILLFVLLLVAGAGAVYFYMMSAQPEYTAKAVVQILRNEESRTAFDKVSDDSVRGTEDINTQIQLLGSLNVITAVAGRIEADPELKSKFIEPYLDLENPDETPAIEAILAEQRAIAPARLSLIVTVEYEHANPEVASTVANIFADEMARYYTRVRGDAITRAIQDLREQAEIQRRKVENLEKQLVDFKEDLKTISFDQRLDIDQQEMVSLKSFATQKAEIYDRLKNEMKMLEERRESGGELQSLPFIAESSRVTTLLSAVASHRIEIARLAERYRSKHPRMIEANEALVAAERELNQAIDERTRLLDSQLAQAEMDLEKAIWNVDTKKQEIIDLQRHEALYKSKERELEVNQNLYQYFYNRIQQAEAQKRDDINKIRMVDRAIIPLVPSSPNPYISIAAALVAGLAIAFGTVVTLIFFDDHVKSHGDVERKLGLPIIGMLNLIRGNYKTLGELVGLSSRDHQNTETFNAIVASLRLDPSSARSKCILVTSTISDEGKSYVSACLASAFERYGEKALLINCDLRAREDRLQLLSGHGLVPYLEDDSKSLQNAIYHSQQLDCDVLPAGGFHRQPYRLFTNPRFQKMLQDLKDRYGRIIIDTPPVHLFGDALSLLPMCDGQIFVSGFGRARISLATKTVKKLKDTDCPIFGAIINGVKSYQAKMYYPSHYKEMGAYSNYNDKRAARY